MKVVYLFIISLIILFSLQNCYAEKKEVQIQWINGVAIIDGVPTYFNPFKIDIPDFEMPADYIKIRKKEKKIEGFYLEWLFKNDSKGHFYVYGYDKKYGSRNTDTSRELFYKIENNAVYISEDRSNWEKLYIKFLRQGPYTYKNTQALWRMYLKCRWFEGEYIITGTAFDGIIALPDYFFDKTTGSSYLKDNNKDKYIYWRIFDNDPSTAWVEGRIDDGTGEYIEIINRTFATDTAYIDILPGLAGSIELFKRNNRPKDIEIKVIYNDDPKPIEKIFKYTLEDKMEYQRIKLPFEGLKKSIVLNIRITIKSVYKGSKYSDTCISEIRLFDKDGSDSLERIRNYIREMQKSMKENAD